MNARPANAQKKGVSRVSLIVVCAYGFAFCTAWGGLIGNLGPRYLIFASALLVLGSGFAAAGIGWELRNHHWKKRNFTLSAVLILMAGIGLGSIPIIAQLRASTESRQAAATVPLQIQTNLEKPWIRSTTYPEFTRNLNVFVGQTLFTVRGTNRAITGFGAEFYEHDGRLMMDANLWLPPRGGRKVVSNDFSLLNPTLLQQNQNAKAMEIADMHGRVIFQWIRDHEHLERIYGMFRGPGAVRVADVTGTITVEITDTNELDRLTNGLQARRIFKYPQSLYPGEIEK